MRAKTASAMSGMMSDDRRSDNSGPVSTSNYWPCLFGLPIRWTGSPTPRVVPPSSQGVGSRGRRPRRGSGRSVPRTRHGRDSPSREQPAREPRISLEPERRLRAAPPRSPRLRRDVGESAHRALALGSREGLLDQRAAGHESSPRSALGSGHKPLAAVGGAWFQRARSRAVVLELGRVRLGRLSTTWRCGWARTRWIPRAGRAAGSERRRRPGSTPARPRRRVDTPTSCRSASRAGARRPTRTH